MKHLFFFLLLAFSLPAFSQTTSYTHKGTATDKEGPVTVVWTLSKGPSCTIVTPASLTTQVTGMTAGEYTFKLTATDNQGATAFDTVHITVKPQNTPPSVDAGPDQIIQIPGTVSMTLRSTGTLAMLKE